MRDHLMSTMPADVLASMGLTPDDFLQIVRAQTLMIMTAPFSELNLMMLTPDAPASRATTPVELPSSPLDWLRMIRDERRKAKASRQAGDIQPIPPRGEMLLIKQLVFFERYGKLFLGDEPLDLRRRRVPLAARPHRRREPVADSASSADVAGPTPAC